MSKHELHNIRTALHLLKAKLEEKTKIEKQNQKIHEDYLRAVGKTSNNTHLHYSTLYFVYFSNNENASSAYPTHAYVFGSIDELESFMNENEFHEKMSNEEQPVIWQFFHDKLVDEFPSTYRNSKSFINGWARQKATVHVEMKPVYSMIGC